MSPPCMVAAKYLGLFGHISRVTYSFSHNNKICQQIQQASHFLGCVSKTFSVVTSMLGSTHLCKQMAKQNSFWQKLQTFPKIQNLVLPEFQLIWQVSGPCRPLTKDFVPIFFASCWTFYTPLSKKLHGQIIHAKNKPFLHHGTKASLTICKPKILRFLTHWAQSFLGMQIKRWLFWTFKRHQEAWNPRDMALLPTICIQDGWQPDFWIQDGWQPEFKWHSASVQSPG